MSISELRVIASSTDRHIPAGSQRTENDNNTVLWRIFALQAARSGSSQTSDLTHMQCTQFVELLGKVSLPSQITPNRLRLIFTHVCTQSNQQRKPGSPKKDQVSRKAVNFPTFLSALVEVSKAAFPMKSGDTATSVQKLYGAIRSSFEATHAWSWLPWGSDPELVDKYFPIPLSFLETPQMLKSMHRFCKDEGVVTLLQGRFRDAFYLIFDNFSHGARQGPDKKTLKLHEWLALLDQLLYFNREVPHVLSRQQLIQIFVYSCQSGPRSSIAELSFLDMLHSLAVTAYCVVRRRSQDFKESFDGNLHCNFSYLDQERSTNVSSSTTLKYLLQRIQYSPLAQSSHHIMVPFCHEFKRLHKADGSPSCYLRDPIPETKLEGKKWFARAGLLEEHEQPGDDWSECDLSVMKEERDHQIRPTLVGEQSTQRPDLSITSLMHTPLTVNCGVKPTSLFRRQPSATANFLPTLPLNLLSPDVVVVHNLSNTWIQYIDETTGKPYFMSLADKSTSWTRPKRGEVVEYRKGVHIVTGDSLELFDCHGGVRGPRTPAH